MFEHYLHHQAPDSRRRWRVALAVNVAGFATMSMVGFTWLMDKLMIAQVEPPTTHYVMVQMDMDTLPPPPAPPAAPAVKPVPEIDETPEEDPLVPPDFDEDIPKVKPKTAKITGTGIPTSTGTSPIGNTMGIPGIPGGLPKIPGIGTPGVPTIGTHKQPESRPPLPISAVLAQAIYTPPPDRNRLSGTRAAMFDKRPGENETSFCVDPQGRTVDVRTTKKFPNDPKVDEICRETVKTWRFKPFLVDGRPVKTCSIQVFNLTFKE